MKLILDDGTEYAIEHIDDVKVVRDVSVSVWAHVTLSEMTPESVLKFAYEVLSGMLLPKVRQP